MLEILPLVTSLQRTIQFDCQYFSFFYIHSFCYEFQKEFHFEIHLEYKASGQDIPLMVCRVIKLHSFKNIIDANLKTW